jgi:RNA polymerase sigma factor (sigma-70 family)
MAAAPTKRREDLLRDDRRCRDAFRKGERWAMTRVYRYYLPLVKTVAVHGFGTFKGFYDPIDQEDCIQNIFATAFEERVRLRYNGIDPFAAFLRGLGHNVVRQMLDKRRRFQRVPDPVPESHETVEDAYIEHEVAALCRKFRASLQAGSTDLAILDLYFVDGWAEERLAEHLGLTRYRLRKHIKQLHRRMQKYLKGHGIGLDSA